MGSFRLTHNIQLDPPGFKEFELNRTQRGALRETPNISKQAGDALEHFQECITNNSRSSSIQPVLKEFKSYESLEEHPTFNVFSEKEEGEVTDSSFDTDLNKEDLKSINVYIHVK